MKKIRRDAKQKVKKQGRDEWNGETIGVNSRLE